MAEFDSFLAKVLTQIVNPLIELVFALAIGYFLYGVFQFISNQDNEEMKTTGKSHMIWGVVGIAIMLGVWGIMNIITRTFGFDSDIKIDSSGNQGQINIDLKK
jgi:uncharacterized membrane protein YidH (DUF202 family)